jgi:CheY-like chemotaxis protein
MLAFGDTGEGMTAETKTRIFEPFFTTKGPGKGTGLGLATVYGIVKQCGGFILVYSDPGVGTTFRIYFPRFVSEAQAAHTPKAHFPETHGAETILVAEDEPAIRQIVVEMLRSFGYGVIPATNGQEALRAFQSHSGSIDLLITDAMMPCMSGLELADALHKERPSLRVLFLSGHSDPASFARDRKIQTLNFLQKPFTASSLSEKVRNLLCPLPGQPAPVTSNQYPVTSASYL